MRLKLLLAVLVLSVFSLQVRSEEIPKNLASRVAKNFYYHHSDLDYDAIYFEEDYTVSSENGNVYYVFNLPANLGFVIVSAEKNTYPVLGYSNSGKFIPDDLPDNVGSWMKGYEDQILYVRQNQLTSNKYIENEWYRYVEGFSMQRGNRDVVGPLLDDLIWDQGCYFNDSCPSDVSGPCFHVWAGCVATATSMVMKYHHHPHQGNGSYSYNHATYGTQSANFGNTVYDWTNMPENTSNEEVAQLMYHVGVSVDMDYGPSGSGAVSSQTVSALQNYFEYDPSGYWAVKSNFTDPVWEGMVTGELDADRPLIYRGSGTGGHCFVCDGYDDDYQGGGQTHFHFNWGWSGAYNGYFHLSSLNPGSYNFTNDQAAAFSIQPRTDIVPYSDFQADANTACVGNTIDFSDRSSYAPDSWSWSFPGGSPATSTDENPTVTYSTPGLYDVTLTASNATGTGNTQTRTEMIRVCNDPTPASCTPYTVNLGNFGYGIIRVKLNNLDNITGDTYYDNGCLDLTCSQSATLQPGNTYTLELTIAVGNSGDAHTNVYMDFNNDGDFADAGETIINDHVSSVANRWNFITQNITMPNDPAILTLLRMRISTDYGTLATACSYPVIGQYEDYGIYFKSSPAPPVALPADSITQDSFYANWHPSSGADGYYLFVATDSLFTSYVSGYDSLDVGSDTSYQVSGLTVETDYFYRVKAYNTYGISGNSDTIKVTTLPYPPEVPNALPAINQTQNSFDAIWNTAMYADGYVLWVAMDSLFQNTLFNYDSLDVGSDTSQNVTGLMLNSPYFYRVISYNEAGFSGSSDTIKAWTLPNLPAAPSASSATNIGTNSFDANWYGSFGADGFILDVAVDSLFLNKLANYDSLDVGNVFTYTVEGLNPETKYFYRLLAYNAAGTSPYSNVVDVTTLPGPPPPPLAAPASNITQTIFEANWYPVASADGYYLDVSEDSLFASFLPGFENLNTFDDTTWTVFGVEAETEYFYRVRAYNTGGTSGNSNVIGLITLPFDPNAPMAQEATNIQQESFDANWDTVAGSLGYYLDVALDYTFNNFVPGHENLFVGIDTTYHVDSLDSDTQYFYRLRSENAAGQSMNSNVIQVTTLPYPPQVPEALEATNVSFFTFDANWTESEYSDGYLLDVGLDPDFNEFLAGFQNFNTWDNTSWTVYGVEQDTFYYYRVRAYNWADTSDYSNVITVHTLGVGLGPGITDNGLISIYSRNNEIFIKASNPSQMNGYVQVYNILGQPLLNRKLENTTINHYSVPQGSGLVIVSVILEDRIISKKLLIR